MHLQFVGCGDAFGSGGRFNTCFHLVGRDINALIDCGATSLVSMNRLAISRASSTRPPPLARRSNTSPRTPSWSSFSTAVATSACDSGLNEASSTTPSFTPCTVRVSEATTGSEITARVIRTVRVVAWALDHRWAMVGLAVLTFVGAIGLQIGFGEHPPARCVKEQRWRDDGRVRVVGVTDLLGPAAGARHVLTDLPQRDGVAAVGRGDGADPFARLGGHVGPIGDRGLGVHRCPAATTAAS